MDCGRERAVQYGAVGVSRANPHVRSGVAGRERTSMVAIVGHSPDLPDADSNVSRRRLLSIAGGAGLASLVAACSPPSKTAPAATAFTPSESPTILRATPTVGAAPPPTVAETPTPAVSGVMLCPHAWGARPARPGGRPHTIDRMTLHHSAVALPDNRGIIARLQQHQRYHQDDKGWVDIAYHVAVDREGNIFQLRDTAIAGDTATEYDTAGHFLVLAEGNFDEEPVSEAQLSGTALAFAWAAQRFGLSVDTLASHREVAPGTSCPGQNLEAHMTSGDLHQRVADLLVGGVDLRPLCGPEADARVAAIEAGR